MALSADALAARGTPETGELLETLRADTVLADGGPDAEAIDACLRRAVQAREKDARTNGREDQIAEVDRYCAEITTELTGP